MKKRFFLFFVLTISGSAFSIDLTVSPTNMAWSEQGWMELSITDIAEEAGVDIALYVDVNGDGVVNGNDFVGAVFGIDDGEVNPFGAESFVDDNDGLTNGAIESTISFYGLAYSYAHTIGDYIIQAVEINDFDEGIATTAVPFSVTQPTSTVWITGVVCDYVSSNVVAGARVEMGYFSDMTGVTPAVWAGTNGEFILYVPEGISPSDVAGVFASAAEHLSVEEDPENGDLVSFCFFTNGLVMGENALVDPLRVVPATEAIPLYEVSGTVYGIESWDGGAETNTLSGVLVEMEGDDDDDELFSWDVTDEDGSFTLVFPGNSNGVLAYISCENPLLNLRGIVGSFADVMVTGTMSGVEITCYYAEALARARVTDKDTGEPIEGVEVYFESDDFISDAYTTSNGFYEIGLRAGTYQAECDDESLTYQHYVEPDWWGGLIVSNGAVFTNAPFEVDPGYIVSGNVYDTNSNPLVDGMVVLIDKHDEWLEWINDVDTDSSGSYTLLAPTGTLYVRTEDFGDYNIGLYYSNAVIGDIESATPINVTTAGLSGIDFYLSSGARVEGMVQDQNMNPISWNWVWAYNQSGECIGAGQTEWGGGFGFALPAESNVTLRTDLDDFQSYPRTWYGDTCSHDLATAVSLTNGQTSDGLNIQVFPGYEVYGNVINQTGLTGIAGAGVTAFDINSNRFDSVTTDGSGNYDDLYMPTNVGLVFYAGADGYAGEFYDNVYDPAEATGIMTSAYSYVSIPFVLYASDLDSDADGLPDFVEDAVPDGGYDPGADYANRGDPDTDDDGTSDGAEYIAGTNPQDSDSFFEIVDGAAVPDGAFFAWSSVLGREYFVQEKTNLVSGIWSNVYSVTATADTTSYTNDATLDYGFYRVRVSAP